MNSLPKTVTRQRRDCDLNPGPSPHRNSQITNPSRPTLAVPGASHSWSSDVMARGGGH